MQCSLLIQVSHSSLVGELCFALVLPCLPERLSAAACGSTFCQDDFGNALLSQPRSLDSHLFSIVHIIGLYAQQRRTFLE